jgi:hypothetical protein
MGGITYVTRRRGGGRGPTVVAVAGTAGTAEAAAAAVGRGADEAERAGATSIVHKIHSAIRPEL